MAKRMHAAGFAAALILASAAAFAKIPPPPPMDPAAKAAADEKAKQEQAAAEEATIKNYQANMRKMGKPIPKPVPTAATSTPPKGGQVKPQANTQKAAAKKG